MKTILGMMLLLSQLSAPGGGLPQVMKPEFKPVAPLTAGKKGTVEVSFTLMKGYAINRTPPVSLKLKDEPGLKLDKLDFASSPNDPKSKDEYYVDLPKLRVPVTASKPGLYEITGKLVYFFCSKADGFCSRQVVDVTVPIRVQ